MKLNVEEIFVFQDNTYIKLKDASNIPDKVVTSQRTVATGIEAPCILLKRLMFPYHYTDMVPVFGRLF